MTITHESSTNALGTTGFDISRVGLGAFAIGGPQWSYGWGAQDDDESVSTILAAVEKGINWVDTAAVYGRGHSELIVGRATAQLADSERPYIFTKGGLVWSEPDALTTGERKVGAPASLRAEVEASLQRLGVETIDLYQMHWPAEDGTSIEEYWSALVDLRTAGKLRAIGLSNHTVEQLEAAEKIGHVDTLQPPFSAIYREAAADLLPWCADNGTGVIVYSPMQSGLLTGTFTAERAAALPENDWRSRHPDFQGEGLARNLAVADAMSQVAKRHEVSTAEVAIAWTLGFRGVSGAIVGARRPDQIDGWINAGELVLTSDDYLEIAAAIESRGAGSGPIHPAAAQ